MTAERACRACPWRVSNQGKRHPDGWFTKATLRRLWAQLRNGEQMSCHPTDPGNPLSDRALAAGFRPAPEGTRVRECTGALIVQQREFMTLQDGMAADIPRYRRERSGGLTKRGIVAVLERALFGGVWGSAPLPRPDLTDPDVGVPWLTWERPA